MVLRCADVQILKCIADLFAGGVLWRFSDEVSNFCVTLSCAVCVPSKVWLDNSGCSSVLKSTSFGFSELHSNGGPRGSCADDRMHVGDDLGSSRLAGLSETSGVILRVGVEVVVHPMRGLGVKTFKRAGRNLKQSSFLSVLSAFLVWCFADDFLVCFLLAFWTLVVVERMVLISGK